MSRHYVIDGFNLLYALPELPTGTWQQKRETLVDLIRKRRPQGNNRLTLVFDSREGSGNRERLGEIEIVYTAGETADDWIALKVREVQNPREIVVVTDDQGIRGQIRGTGAKWMGTKEFWNTTRTSEPPSTRKKPAEANEITDELRKKWL